MPEPHAANYRNIIFDFGGVICNIDPDRTFQALKSLGSVTSLGSLQSKMTRDLYEKLELGLITGTEFTESVRVLLGKHVSHDRIRDTWNAMILDIPASRILLIERLKRDHRIFLLSNTNEIHYHYFLHSFRERFGYSDFDELFEKVYFSYRLKMKKPDPAIFRFVLEDSGLVAAETLFIDDSVENILGAKSTGMAGLHLKNGEDILDILSEKWE